MNELLERLHDEFKRLVHAQRSMYEAIERDGRSLSKMTAEEASEFERREADIAALESRIGDVRKQADREREIDQMRADSERALTMPDDVKVVDGYGELEKRALAWARGEGDRYLDIPLAGLSVHRDPATGRNVVRDKMIEQRAALSTTYAAGGATVPQGFRAVLYSYLIQNSAIRQTRATVLTTGSGEQLVMPKVTAHPGSGTIVSEAAAIGETDPTFGAGTLSAYKYANLVPVSHELMTDSGVDILGYLAMAMGRALGNGAGAHFITGTGSSQPQGVLVGAGTVSQTAGGTGQSGVPTYSEMVSIFDSIIPQYQRDAEWIFSQTTLSKLRVIKDSQNRPLWLDGMTAAMPNQIFGKPYYVETNMPNAGTSATSIAFGDFSTYFIRDVEGLRFERSDEYLFNKDQAAFRAILRTDGLLLDTTGAIGTYKGGTS